MSFPEGPEKLPQPQTTSVSFCLCFASFYMFCHLFISIFLSSFSNNTMGDVGAQSLFQEGVRHCPNLEQLWYVVQSLWLWHNISFCNLCARYCLVTYSLFVLILYYWRVRYNNVTDVGVRYLYLEGLQHCPNLNLLA